MEHFITIKKNKKPRIDQLSSEIFPEDTHSNLIERSFLEGLGMLGPHHGDAGPQYKFLYAGSVDLHRSQHEACRIVLPNRNMRYYDFHFWIIRQIGSENNIQPAAKIGPTFLLFFLATQVWICLVKLVIAPMYIPVLAWHDLLRFISLMYGLVAEFDVWICASNLSIHIF